MNRVHDIKAESGKICFKVIEKLAPLEVPEEEDCKDSESAKEMILQETSV